ncbi:MAG: response regulator transcription factor [Eubacteriales bacterium]|nr:response regulator transcription factor [Eubacteriales bacterium]
MKILIVDRDILFVAELTDLAKTHGIEVVTASNGARGFELFSRFSFDAVITELLLPRMDGIELIRKIRLRSDLPLMAITGNPNFEDRRMAYLVGADDVTLKPIEAELVILKLLAIRARQTASVPSQETSAVQGNANKGKARFAVADLVIDLETFDVKINGQVIVLTPKELELLWLLANNSQKVFTRENLLESIWDASFEGDIRTVDSHIKRMRAKLNRLAHPSWEIKTIWGVGYQFVIHQRD